MDEAATMVETLTATASQVGPVLAAAAADPLTYGVAFALALGIYLVRRRKAKK